MIALVGIISVVVLALLVMPQYPTYTQRLREKEREEERQRNKLCKFQQTIRAERQAKAWRPSDIGGAYETDESLKYVPPPWGY